MRRCCGSFLDPQLEHAESCSNDEATREHHACVHAAVCGMKLADPGITTEPRGSLLCNPGRLTSSLPLLSPDAVRPWTCVWPPPLQRQLAEMLHRRHSIVKLSHYRNEIGELRQQGIHYRPLVWTADGRPHPVVTRTRLQPKRAAFLGEIPSSQVETRNPNRSPAPESSHDTSSSPESFSTGRAALHRHHRQSFAPLGTCPRSGVALQYLTTTMTFVSLASYTYESVQPSSL